MNDNSGTNYTFPMSAAIPTTPTYGVEDKEELPTIGDWKVILTTGLTLLITHSSVEHDTEDNSYTFFDDEGLRAVFPYSVVLAITCLTDENKQMVDA